MNKDLPTAHKGLNSEEVNNMYKTLGSYAKVANHFQCNQSTIKYHVERFRRLNEDNR